MVMLFATNKVRIPQVANKCVFSIVDYMIWSDNDMIRYDMIPHMKIMSQRFIEWQTEWQTAGIARVAIRN